MSITKKLPIIYFLFFILLLKNTNSKSFFKDSVIDILYEYIDSSIENSNKTVSDTCINSIRSLFPKLNKNNASININELQEAYLSKLYFSSSKHKNYGITYPSCIEKVDDIIMSGIKYAINTKYLLLEILDDRNYLNQSFIYPLKYFYGICLPQFSCDLNDYKYLFLSLNNIHPEIFYNNPNISSSNINLFLVDEHSNDFKLSSKHFFNFIPLIILVIQLILNIFPIIPYYLSYKIYNCITTQKKRMNVENLANVSSNKYARIEFIEIKNSFNIKDSLEELFPSKLNTSSRFLNESGIGFVKGIVGLNLIFYSIGTVFTILVQSPSSICSEESLKETLRNGWFFIIFYGCRYAPKILLSMSGFTLMYKSEYFFDDRKQELNEEEKEKEKEKESDEESEEDENDEEEEEDDFFGIKFRRNLKKKEDSKKKSDYIKDIKKEDLKIIDNSPINPNETDSQIAVLESTDSEIPIINLFQFLFSQFHKYIIAILIFFFVRYNLYYLIKLCTGLNPLIAYFKKRVLSSCGAKNIIMELLLIGPFDTFNYYKNIDGKLFSIFYDGLLKDYFYLPFQEMLFFVFTSCIIYINYRKKYSIGDFAIVSFCFCLIIELLIFFVNIKVFFPIHYYLHIGGGKFLLSPFMNYPYFLIGLYFGLINYSYQKAITYREALKEERDYLRAPINIVKYFNDKSKKHFYIRGTIIFLLILIFSFSQIFHLQILKDSSNSEIIKGRFEQFFYLVDTIVVVFIFNYAVFGLCSKGKSGVFNFLSNIWWSSLSRSYFSFILILPVVTMYFFYHSDTRIIVTCGNILFYSCIVFVITFILAIIIYILFELPYKRVIKFFRHMKNKEKNN